MKTNLFILLVFISFSSSLNAQGDKVIFLELGGHGTLYSVNYDFRFSKENFGLGLTTGLGIHSYTLDDTVNGLIIAGGMELNKTWGENSWHPEIGVGFEILRDDDGDNALVAILPRTTFAIRFQKQHSRFFFRTAIYLTGTLGYEDIRYPFIWAGIGLGYTFN